MTATVIRGDARHLPLPDASAEVPKPPPVHDDQIPMFDLAR